MRNFFINVVVWVSFYEKNKKSMLLCMCAKYKIYISFNQ
jgi:hypothetical protein